jgi:hypothetical protein
MSGTTDTLECVSFINNEIGWVAGQNGTILHTTNGGINWESIESGTTNWLRSIHFTDALTGWVTGRGGKILQTSDGGANWTDQSITDIDLNDIFITGLNHGWAVGDGGTILHGENTGFVGVKTLGAPHSAFVVKAYPNPFEKQTTLSYSLQQSSFVNVTVFDITGHMISRTSHGMQPMGTHEILFDGAGLPAGIYYFELKTGEYIYTSKLIKL